MQLICPLNSGSHSPLVTHPPTIYSQRHAHCPCRTASQPTSSNPIHFIEHGGTTERLPCQTGTQRQDGRFVSNRFAPTHQLLWTVARAWPSVLSAPPWRKERPGPLDTHSRGNCRISAARTVVYSSEGIFVAPNQPEQPLMDGWHYAKNKQTIEATHSEGERRENVNEIRNWLWSSCRVVRRNGVSVFFRVKDSRTFEGLVGSVTGVTGRRTFVDWSGVIRGLDCVFSVVSFR